MKEVELLGYYTTKEHHPAGTNSSWQDHDEGYERWHFQVKNETFINLL